MEGSARVCKEQTEMVPYMVAHGYIYRALYMLGVAHFTHELVHKEYTNSHRGYEVCQC